jgi:FkbM family methyltransferase
MKTVVKAYLKKSPLVYEALRRVYNKFFPEPVIQQQQAIANALKENADVFFVQVGANDGVHDDPIHNLIVKDERWAGIFIEPVRFLFERLRGNYGADDRFTFENVAIGSEEGTRKFYYIAEEAKGELGSELPLWSDGLGSFDKNHILKHLDGNLKHLDGRLASYIVEEEVECVPLPGILSRNSVEKIDLLHIDVEGFDYRVLAQFDFKRYKPVIILYEHKNLSREEREKAKSLLEMAGYDLTEYGCGDTLAVVEN